MGVGIKDVDRMSFYLEVEYVRFKDLEVYVNLC